MEDQRLQSYTKNRHPTGGLKKHALWSPGGTSAPAAALTNAALTFVSAVIDLLQQRQLDGLHDEDLKR
jgi:hypothetical protein